MGRLPDPSEDMWGGEFKERKMQRERSGVSLDYIGKSLCGKGKPSS